jgi:hypothetical protein
MLLNKIKRTSLLSESKESKCKQINKIHPVGLSLSLTISDKKNTTTPGQEFIFQYKVSHVDCTCSSIYLKPSMHSTYTNWSRIDQVIS